MKIENSYFNCNNISEYYCFYGIIRSNKCSTGDQKRLLSTDPKLLNSSAYQNKLVHHSNEWTVCKRFTFKNVIKITHFITSAVRIHIPHNPAVLLNSSASRSLWGTGPVAVSGPVGVQGNRSTSLSVLLCCSGVVETAAEPHWGLDTQLTKDRQMGFDGKIEGHSLLCTTTGA